jgi:hypothetical protein
MTPRAKFMLVAEIEAHVSGRKDIEHLRRALQLSDYLDGAAVEFGANDCAIKRARDALLKYWMQHYV